MPLLKLISPTLRANQRPEGVAVAEALGITSFFRCSTRVYPRMGRFGRIFYTNNDPLIRRPTPQYMLVGHADQSRPNPDSQGLVLPAFLIFPLIRSKSSLDFFAWSRQTSRFGPCRAMEFGISIRGCACIYTVKTLKQWCDSHRNADYLSHSY